MNVPIAPDQSKRKKHNLVLVVLLLAAMGSGGWMWHTRTTANAAAFSPGPVHSVLHLDTFVLNLSGGDERAYLRAGVDLGLREDTERKGGSPAPIALIRDTILGVLATAHSDDVLTPQGKQALKVELVRALRDRVPGLGVEEVYFTEFLIQR
jgi:flagellar FliL protein